MPFSLSCKHGSENELRLSKPPTPQPPPRVQLDPWARSRLMRQNAPVVRHHQRRRKLLTPTHET
ncbi:unnamed protein product [Brassica oleracea]